MLAQGNNVTACMLVHPDLGLFPSQNQQNHFNHDVTASQPIFLSSAKQRENIIITVY